MREKRFTIVGIGEILWDLFPDGKKLGGAPTNFAYISNLLGDVGIPASRLGDDAYGHAARRNLQHLCLSTAAIQDDTQHPSGTVQVELDARGQPQFEITENVAWDFLEWTPEWCQLAARADAVCFGSLAQRNAASRETIRSFLRACRPEIPRVFDANLRQHFYDEDILRVSFELATIVKMNGAEAAAVAQLMGMSAQPTLIAARELLREYELDLMCITRGEEGSLLISHDAIHEHPGVNVKVADTVGAGDAFTAGLLHHHLRGANLAEMNEAANQIGSWVASRVGGTPARDETFPRIALRS